MKRKKNLISFSFAFLLLLFVFSCEHTDEPADKKLQYPPDNQQKVSITQGVWGNVWFWEGDFMPIIDPDNAKITPVVREIYVHEATTETMVERSPFGFYTKINSKLMTVIQSDKDGFFQVALDPGKYSFFVKEDTAFYANLFDGQGCICPATVTADSVTKIQIDITYRASF